MKTKLPFLATLLIVSFATHATSPKLDMPARQIIVSESARLALKGQVTTQQTISTTPTKVKAASTVPYFYSFENSDISTDGWLITDASSLMIASKYSTSPYGDYSLTSRYDAKASRAAWAFSQAVTLTAGTEYYVSIYVYAPGYNTIIDEFKITVGSAQTAASQTKVIIDKSGANATIYGTWTKLTGSFIAEADGNYYFGINHGTIATDVNIVAFDAFGVNAGSAFVYPPNPKLSVSNGGLWSATSATDKVILSPTETVDYTSTTTSATSILWSFTGDATPDVSENSVATVKYSSAGDKTASLEAVGAGGTASVNTAFNVTLPADGVTDKVWNINVTDPLTLYTLATNNYLVGINSSWKRVAEKYTLPANVSVTLNSIGFYVGNYVMSSTNRSKNVVITIYSVGSNGLPGISLGSYTVTFGTLFGTASITPTVPALKTYTLTTPLTITGSFFIEANFSSYTSTASASNNIGLFSSSARSIDYNTTYAYYQSIWTPVGDLTGKISAAILPSLAFKTPIFTSVDQTENANLKFFVNNGILNIDHATTGSPVSVYDITGKLTYTNVITSENSSFPLNLKSGVYLVKVGDKVSKVAVK